MEVKTFDELSHNQRMSFILKKCEPNTKNRISINKSKDLIKKLNLAR